MASSQASPILSKRHFTMNYSSGSTEKSQKFPKNVIVYDPTNQMLTTEPLENLLADDKPAFEVPLPSRWSNKVDVYQDEQQTDFLATIHLDKLGLVKNTQRRMRMDFFKLYIRVSTYEKPQQKSTSDKHAV